MEQENVFPDYETYETICDEHSLKEEERMTKEEYEKDFVEISKRIKETGLNFIPSLPGSRSISNKVSSSIGAFSAAAGLAKTFAQNANEVTQGIAAASIASQAVMNEITRLTGGTIKTNSFDNTGSQVPLGPSGAGGGGTRGNPFDAQRLSINTKPVEVSWNTNIKPNTYSPYFIDATKHASPLHISCVRFGFPTHSDVINRYLDTFITLAYQNAIQKSVSFNINLKTCTSDKIIGYMNDVSTALQVYYWLTSIISYADGIHNKNEGMLYLRQLLTAEELNELYNLQRVLLQMPIPPKLMELIFYIMQNFKSSPLPGSSILKICPTGITLDGYRGNVPFDMTRICTDSLTSAQNREISSLFARACPTWINSQLLSAPPTPLHDNQFITLFANLPFTTHLSKIGKNVHGPLPMTDKDVSKDKIGTYIYNSYVDILDGGIFGLFTGATSTDNFLPGMMLPISIPHDKGNSLESRFSYVCTNILDVGGSIEPIFGSSDLAASRGETYTQSFENGIMLPFQRFGTERCEAVTASNVTQSSFALIEWLMCLDDIGNGTKQKENFSKASNYKGKTGNKKKRWKK